MDGTCIALMNPEEICQTLKSAELQQAYERALRQSERIYEEERWRTLRLERLLVEHANDALQYQLEEVELQLEELEDREGNTQEKLYQLDADLQRTQNELRTKTREVEKYRSEVNAMAAVSTDSAKLLTEKLALGREVAALKPEIEHLRAQGATNQNLLAEKLGLQRELSTLQVELETERRAVQRTKSNASKSIDTDSKLTSQLEELRKELAKERREAQKHERESRKQATEWESQKTILESKLDAFRNKLRATKEQLKEAEKVIEDNQTSKTALAQKMDPPPTKATVANPRKRQTAHFDPDASIGTPGNNGVHAAKRAKISALPGDKSTFSITPFLNRTMSILPDTPDVQEVGEKDGNTSVSPTTKAMHAKQPKGRKPAAASTKSKQRRALEETKSAPKANYSITTGSKSPARKALSLPQVREEDGNEENEEPVDIAAELNKAVTAPVTKKKKQKMLGHRQSLFDEDDSEETKSRARTVGLLGATRGLGLRGGGSVGSISLGNRTKTLAEFSPLKKDWRKTGPSSGNVS